MRKVVLIGDSIRMGYEPFVREKLAGAADVTGSKENGGTSANVLAHLDEWALSAGADLVHVNCGLHDIRRERGGSGAEVPLDAYRANVEAVLKGLVDSGARVIWATTTPVIEERHNTVKPFDRLSTDVAAYNRAAMDIACGLGVEVDDLFEVVTRSGAPGLLAEDGVHFTKAGYRLLGDAVADAVRRALGS